MSPSPPPHAAPPPSQPQPPPPPPLPPRATLSPPIRPSLPGLFEPPRLSPSQLRLAGLAFSAANFAACLPLAPRVFCFLAYLLYFVYFPQLFAEVITRDRGDNSPRSDLLASRATPPRQSCRRVSRCAHRRASRATARSSSLRCSCCSRARRRSTTRCSRRRRGLWCSSASISPRRTSHRACASCCAACALGRSGGAGRRCRCALRTKLQESIDSVTVRFMVELMVASGTCLIRCGRVQRSRRYFAPCSAS